MRKSTGMFAASLFGLAALGAISLAGCGGKSDDAAPSTGKTTTDGASTSATTPKSGGKITIAWAQWKPSDYLDELGKEYTKETGTTVEVKQIPWTDFQNKIQTEVWSGHSDAYDLIVGDSQWLGRGATEKHYTDLTDWAKTNVPWAEISPAAKQFYCDYEGKTYAVPCEADAIGFAYRKDLFEDAKNKADFQAKYKHELAPPKTWAELRDLAEFFTRMDPTTNKQMYGLAPFYAGGGGYDGITMGFDEVLWCYGGDLKNDKGDVEGVINAPKAVDALKFYTQDLKKFTPPGSEKFYYDETLHAFGAGQVAMAEDWYTFFPGLTSEENTLASKTGFFVSPAGPGGHFISLGGQGLSISAYSKNQDESKKFLAWFSKKDNQQKWAKLGGLTSDTEVLKSSDFQQAAPFNAAFAESAQYLKDFYNNPKYAELLNETQTHWNSVVTGSETPKAAMDAIAKKHTDILKSMKTASAQ